MSRFSCPGCGYAYDEQAGDARGVAKRELLESGGKKEVLMMIPVVFLILPVTVLFAIYPGVSFLRFQL